MIKEFEENYPNFENLVFYVDNLVKELDVVNDINTYPDGQLSVQTIDPDEDTWLSYPGKNLTGTITWERKFCHLNKKLKNTPIEHYLKWIKIPVYRTRIMVSRSKSAYSIHKDVSARLHLPLITNDQCYFLFKNPPEFIHMPANGKTYFVDTRKEHTFINGGEDYRLHLVMII